MWGKAKVGGWLETPRGSSAGNLRIGSLSVYAESLGKLLPCWS